MLVRLVHDDLIPLTLLTTLEVPVVIHCFETGDAEQDNTSCTGAAASSLPEPESLFSILGSFLGSLPSVAFSLFCIFVVAVKNLIHMPNRRPLLIVHIRDLVDCPAYQLDCIYELEVVRELGEHPQIRCAAKQGASGVKRFVLGAVRERGEDGVPARRAAADDHAGSVDFSREGFGALEAVFHVFEAPFTV